MGDVETAVLIDSGSLVTTVSEELHRSLIPSPELHENFKFLFRGHNKTSNTTVRVRTGGSFKK